jgi:hypothetical protein
VAAVEQLEVIGVKHATKQFPLFTTINFIIEQKMPSTPISETIGDYVELAEMADFIRK